MAHNNNPNQAVLSQARQDLQEDITQLQYIVTDAVEKLTRCSTDVSRQQKTLVPDTHGAVQQQAQQLITNYKNIQRQLTQLSQFVQNAKTAADIEVLLQKKYHVADVIRSYQGLMAAIVVSTDWQSPSYDHTQFSQAGRQTGRIMATINDYKRDQHWDAYDFEQAWKKAYIDAPIKFPIHVYATSTGMAAITTVLTFLQLEKKVQDGPIVAGSYIWFETKQLLTSTYGERVVWVDEANTSVFCDTIARTAPRLVVLDTLTNDLRVLTPNLKAIFDSIKQTCKHDVYILLDNTGMGPLYQPFKQLFPKSRHIHLIAVESLNKYYQFGMDRVTGGIICAQGKDVGKLFDYRVHLGTQMPDALVVALPTPHKQLLLGRIARLGRNAAYVTQKIGNHIRLLSRGPIDHIEYPGVGSFFVFSFKPGYRTVRMYKRFVATVMQKAKKHQVNLIAGSSFGLSTTRIYLTALRATETIPFVRVAVGTETVLELDGLVSVFTEAIDTIS